MKLITKRGILPLRSLKVGDLVLCDTQFMPVKSILMYFGLRYTIRLSTGDYISISSRVKVKTKKGFKFPEERDIVLISDTLQPIVGGVGHTKFPVILYDILVDGDIVTAEGPTVRFGA